MTIHAGSDREKAMFDELRLYYLQHIESCAAEKEWWYDLDDSDRDKALVLYRTWKNGGYRTTDDLDAVMEDFEVARREHLQASAESRVVDDYCEEKKEERNAD